MASSISPFLRFMRKNTHFPYNKHIINYPKYTSNLLPSQSVHRRSLSTNAFGSNLPEILHHEGWEGAWKNNVIPWDAGKAAPILKPLLLSSSSSTYASTVVTSTTSISTDSSLLSSINLNPLPSGKVLVPGSGSSYDAIEFAKAGYSTLAIDIAPTAIERAKTVVTSYLSSESKEKSQVQQLLTIKQADFFKLEPGSSYSIIFDYTFLCALPKPLWLTWAQTVTRLIHPEGELVCIIFPIGDFTGGPPFAMSPTTIRDLLIPLGWEELSLQPIPLEYSHKLRQNREYLGRYRLKHNRYPIINIGIPKQKYRK